MSPVPSAPSPTRPRRFEMKEEPLKALCRRAAARGALVPQPQVRPVGLAASGWLWSTACPPTPKPQARGAVLTAVVGLEGLGYGRRASR